MKEQEWLELKRGDVVCFNTELTDHRKHICNLWRIANGLKSSKFDVILQPGTILDVVHTTPTSIHFVPRRRQGDLPRIITSLLYNFVIFKSWSDKVAPMMSHYESVDRSSNQSKISGKTVRRLEKLIEEERQKTIDQKIIEDYHRDLTEILLNHGLSSFEFIYPLTGHRFKISLHMPRGLHSPPLNGKPNRVKLLDAHQAFHESGYEINANHPVIEWLLQET